MEKDFLDDGDPEIISYVNRHINLLNEENSVNRKKTISHIYDKINEEKLNINGMVSQQLMINFNKSILKCFSDPIEKIRETSIKILKELISRCEDMTPFLPYIISILAERVNCHDLEGIANLPEVMRPPPSQKPQMLIKLIETSEEIRLELCELISIIISCCTEEMIVKHLDDMCNILRALAMDPFYEVQRASCRNISEFSRSFRKILLHFSEILARSLLLPLVAKKSKVKIAAIEAIGQVLQCGVYKYNANIMEIMIGFRDPNSVPIKDFYEASNKINYFAFLINDPKASVREMFIRSIGDWIINLEDRYDHYPRLVPYLLSGLFDPMDEIQSTAYEVIEECGVMLEKEREKEFREQKQYGIDSEWTLGGELANLPLPHPFKKRPQFGSRIFIRSHVRKFFHALYKELKDWKIENREKAANLMMLAIIYSEEYMTQFLFQCIPALLELTISKEKEDDAMVGKICKSLELLGRYCEFNAYLPIMKSSLLGEYSDNQEYFRCALKCLNCLISGSLEATILSKGLGIKTELINECLILLNEPQILKSFANMNCQEALQLVEVIFSFINKRASNDERMKIYSLNKNNIMNLSFNLAYITILERPLKLTNVMDEVFADEIIEKFKDFTLFSYLREIALKSNIIYKNMFVEYTSDLCIGEFSFDNERWIKLIILISCHIFLFDLEDDINNLFEIINGIIIKFGNPDLCDSLIKLSYLFLRKLKNLENMAKINYNKYFSFICNSFSFLLEWSLKTELKLKENYLKNFFQNSYLFSQSIVKNNENLKRLFENQTLALPRIIYSWMNLQRKNFKSKIGEIMLFFCEALKNINNLLNSNKSKFDFFYEGVLSSNKKIYLLPYSIDFMIDQYDVLSLPNPTIVKKLFECLLDLFQCMPDYKDQLYKGDEINYDDYDKLINKIIKLAIDAQDNECKEYLMKSLKILWNKTPLNFKIQIQAADYNKQHSRLELLSKVANIQI